MREEKHILDDAGNSLSHSRNPILHNKITIIGETQT